MQSMVYIGLLLSKRISSGTQYIPSMGKVVIFFIMAMVMVMLIPQQGKSSSCLIQQLSSYNFRELKRNHQQKYWLERIVD